MLENMYHIMTFEELACETWHSENKLAKALLEKHDEFERAEFEKHDEFKRAEFERAENADVLDQLNSCLDEMNGMLRILVNDLIEAKGIKRKSQEAIQRFKEQCENMPSDYLETLSVLWDINI